MGLKDWFFKQFPGYYQATDPHKNGAGEGVLQRYLQVYGDELDEDYIPYLDDFLKIIDFVECDDKYLPLIGSILGYPPSIDGVSDSYRKILAYSIAIYKIKGTKKSYEILFNIFNFRISFVEEVPRKKITYDNSPIAIYDNDITHNIYDSDCDYCSGYWIKYNYLGVGNIPVGLLDKLTNIICWLQPINAKFLGFILDNIVELTDAAELNISDALVIRRSVRILELRDEFAFFTIHSGNPGQFEIIR